MTSETMLMSVNGAAMACPHLTGPGFGIELDIAFSLGYTVFCRYTSIGYPISRYHSTCALPAFEPDSESSPEAVWIVRPSERREKGRARSHLHVAYTCAVTLSNQSTQVDGKILESLQKKIE